MGWGTFNLLFLVINYITSAYLVLHSVYFFFLLVPAKNNIYSISMFVDSIYGSETLILLRDCLRLTCWSRSWMVLSGNNCFQWPFEWLLFSSRVSCPDCVRTFHIFRFGDVRGEFLKRITEGCWKEGGNLSFDGFTVLGILSGNKWDVRNFLKDL